MKNFTRILISTSLMLMVAYSSYSQEVIKTANLGIGTLNPAQKLEIGGTNNTIRVDGLTGATYDIAPSASTSNFVYVNSSGDLYAMPNGATGTVLTIGATGIPTWTSGGTASNAWLLTGNTISATYGTNFIGTTATPAAPLEFYVNNAYAGVLDGVDGASGARYNVFFGKGSGGDSTNASYTANHGGVQNIAIGWETLTAAITTTSNIVALGYDALHNNTASNNNAVGAFALWANTTGTPNDAFGYGAGFNITTGTYNLSEGYEAGYYNQTGTDNVAVGDSAMFGTSLYTGATYNTAVGVSALSSIATNGTTNTAVGYEAARHITTGAGNVSVGDQSNYSNQTGYGNVAVGNWALFANTYSGNTAIGESALKNNNAGGAYVSAYVGGPNTAVGDSAMYANVGGVQNVAVGWAALTKSTGVLASNDTNVGNVALGFESMYTVTNGSYNISAGNFAINTATYAENCIAIGFSAMRYEAGTDRGDIAIGGGALAYATGSYDIGIGGSNVGNNTSGLEYVTGNYDIGIGLGAGDNGATAVSGNNSIAIGTSSNFGTTQSDNIAIGASASATGTASSNANNTALGYLATASGSSNATAVGEGAQATTGANNTALGAGAQATAASPGNATAVGAGAVASSSNTVILGSGANVGIGTSTPIRELEVAGTANTVRIDGIGSGGTYDTNPSNSTDQIMYTKSTGDIYSMPNGTTGSVLTIVGGEPAWAANNTLTASLPLTISSGNISISGSNGGVAYGTGSSVGFTVGASGDVLEGQGAGNAPIWTTLATLAGSGDNWGTQVAVTDSSNDAGTPERTLTGNGVTPLKLAKNGAATGQVLVWTPGTGYGTWLPGSANASLTTATIQNGGGSSAVVVTNGTNQVVNSALGNVSIDVQGAAGQVLYGTGSGSSATFTTGGSAGQVLELTAGVPTWTAIPSSTGWNLVGNSGTTPGTNYLGTNDDEGLVFFVNHAYAGSIDPLNTSYSAANVYLGAASTSAPILNGAGNLDAGDNNVGIGLAAMGSTGGPSYTGNGSGSTTGYSSSNVAVGAYALSSAVYSAGNVALGAYSQRFANWGSEIGYNTAAGYQSLYSNSTGQYNTSMGYKSMYGSGSATAVGNFNSALGYQALLAASAGIYSNTALGSNALLNDAGNRNTAVGDSALYSNTTGYYNTALGYQANVTGNPSNATVIGYGATQSASNSVTLGNSSVSSLYLPGYTAVGDILYTSAGTGLVSALTPGTAGFVLESQGAGSPPTWLSLSGVNNVIGTPPIYSTGGATPTVSIQGNSSGTDAGGVLYSTGAGNAAFTLTGTSGYVLESQGAGAPIWVSPSAASGWALTGNSGTTSSNFLGPTTSGEPLIFKVNGVQSGDIDYTTQSVSLGYGAYTEAGTAPLTSGSWQGGGSTTIGYEAAYNCNAGTNGTFIGAYALYSATTPGASSIDVAVGYSSQYYANGNGMIQNTSVGAYSLYSNTVSTSVAQGENETALGYKSMYGSGTSTGYFGNNNTAIGYQALYDNSGGAATSNTAVGSNALYNINTGNRNTAVGDSALYSNTTGYYNTAVGYQANVTGNPTNATVIGYQATSSTSNSVTLGNSSVSALYLPGYNTVTGDLLYTSAASGLVSSLSAGTSGQVLTSQGSGSAPTWTTVTPANSITGTAPIYINGSTSTPNVNIEGLPSGTDAGGVLYSTGAGNSAVFTSTPASAGLVLTSAASGGAPTWQATPSASGAWSLTGNASAAYGTNFLGYTTASATNSQIEFLTNGAYAGVLDVNRANILFGRGAGGDSTSAAYTAKTGTEQEAIGAGALESATTAAAIVAIGYDALHNYTTGAGQGNGFSNNAVGALALYSLTTGIPNNALGNAAGYSITTGTYNVSLGDVAMYGQTTGSNNVAAGDSALFGGSSFTSPTSYTYAGSQNTAVGVSALAAIGTGTSGGTGGTDNTAVGYEAGIHNTVANNNTNLGYKANYANSTGYGNVAVGANTLFKNSHSDEVAVGTNALYNTSGVGNSGVGDSSLYSNTSGTYNTAVGYQALTTTSGSNGNTTGSYNTALGYLANVSSGALTNATAIGAYAYAAQSNSMVLGSINGVNGATSNTNVCIGTNTPQSDAALCVKTLHLETQGSVGSETAGTGVTSVTLTGTDVSGVVNFTIPATQSSGGQVTVNFASTYGTAPTVVITPANANAGAIVSAGQPYVTTTTLGFTINFNAAPGNVSSEGLSFNYFVIEPQ